jgi:hypothetical protein
MRAWPSRQLVSNVVVLETPGPFPSVCGAWVDRGSSFLFRPSRPIKGGLAVGQQHRGFPILGFRPRPPRFGDPGGRFSRDDSIHNYRYCVKTKYGPRPGADRVRYRVPDLPHCALSADGQRPAASIREQRAVMRSTGTTYDLLLASPRKRLPSSVSPASFPSLNSGVPSGSMGERSTSTSTKWS